jgi:NAD-dependent dihydropyrimidine dehydrogenase PreA subunit
MATTPTNPMFIRLDVDNDVVKKTQGLAAKLVEVCPVNIFKAGSAAGTVDVVDANVDECTLCDLCMQASPDGVKVVKLYES